jgi:hypothetical protein
MRPRAGDGPFLEPNDGPFLTNNGGLLKTFVLLK